MITAALARELTHSINNVVDKILPQIDSAVRAAAVLGRRHVDFNSCFYTHNGMSVVECVELHAKPQPNELQLQLIEKLKSFGFQAKLSQVGEPYVPRGLQDDDGNGVMHVNYGIRVEW